MKLSDDIVEKIHVALGRASMCWDPLPGQQVFQSTRAKQIGQELCDYIATAISNDACGAALQKLWDEILVVRRPTYGDWEYPGQAYRHIKAKYEDICTAGKKLAEYALASSLINTSEYMMGLVEKINRMALALNEENRAIFDPTEGRIYLRPCNPIEQPTSLEQTAAGRGTPAAVE